MVLGCSWRYRYLTVPLRDSLMMPILAEETVKGFRQRKSFARALLQENNNVSR